LRQLQGYLLSEIYPDGSTRGDVSREYLKLKRTYKKKPSTTKKKDNEDA
jgi:hypothetical protein